ncbi:MAG: recombinase family protein [Lachnospiraceae bacterium]|jgi:DNA invertase Pin-like site-specific DNA recombinase|nr:recombinase family protein [Lachnospiraceae bacterium]
MREYGYVRVSDANQNEDRQLIEMQRLNIPDERVYVDKISGKDFECPAYKELVKKLEEGDTLYLTSIDRLGRNYEDIQNQWRILTKERGVDIAVTDMPLLDTRINKDLMGTFIADLVLQILSFVSHTERDHIKKRQAEGIAAVRARGVHMGRPVKRPPADFMKLAKLWKHGKLTITELKMKTGLNESTLYRRLREHEVSRRK